MITTLNSQAFEDAEMKVYAVIIDSERMFTVNVYWSVNLPNNPSWDEVLEEFVEDYYGVTDFKYFCIDNHNKFETGALNYLFN